jgi:mono/diheme cytochrome c family protein
MVASMTFRRAVLALASMVISSLAAGCASADDPIARPAGSSGTSGQTSAGLSLAFASKCARCHGTTATGQGIYPPLPGSLTAAAYAATVRAGRKEMPSFDTSQISDADLAADYQWLSTTKR